MIERLVIRGAKLANDLPAASEMTSSRSTRDPMAWNQGSASALLRHRLESYDFLIPPEFWTGGY